MLQQTAAPLHPQGGSMTGYSAEDIGYMADWANTLPGKLPGYRTPDELFEAELDRHLSKLLQLTIAIHQKN